MSASDQPSAVHSKSVSVPPLDGSRVVAGLMKDGGKRYLSFFYSNPFVVPAAFFLILLVGGEVIAVPLDALARLLLGL